MLFGKTELREQGCFVAFLCDGGNVGVSKSFGAFLATKCRAVVSQSKKCGMRRVIAWREV